MRNLYLPLAIILFSILISCNRYPEADFYEVNGIVSIEAASLGNQNNWRAGTGNNPGSMVSYEDPVTTAGRLTFPFFIRRPGVYSIWTLSSSTFVNADSDENQLILQVLDSQDFLLDQFIHKPGDSGDLLWTSGTDISEPLRVNFSQPGHYRVVFDSGGQAGFVINKLHLSLNNAREPEGFGYPETHSYQIDPILEKRSERVVIPPAWSFGLIAGANTEESTNIIARLIEQEIPVDAVWFSTDTIHDPEIFGVPDFHDRLPDSWENVQNHNIRMGLKLGRRLKETLTEDQDDQFFNNRMGPLFDAGLAFFAFTGEIEFSLREKAFLSILDHGSIENQRGFVLADISSGYQPQVKEYPASITGGIASSQKVSGRAERNSYDFNSLRETIKKVANPRLTTYEIPFLSVQVTGSECSGQPLSEELFLRWIQFAAFQTMMHVDLSTDGNGLVVPFEYSMDTQYQFKELLKLRNRLFPYIYSLAHLVRPTGVKPVRGDAKHPDQFRLGNAFLVAPVYEEGADDRLVYLPDGLWYDYREGMVYEGNQYLTSDAPLSRIPVFVKAGSIIPYRENSRNIFSGSNDRLTIEIYGGDRGTFRLYEDDGITTRYQLGEFSTTAFRYFEHEDYATFTIGRMVREYRGQADQKEFLLLFKHVDEPITVTANDESLDRGNGAGQWQYEENDRVLKVNWIQPNQQKTDFFIQF